MRSLATAVVVLALSLPALSGCAALSGQSRASAGKAGGRDCASCARMCEVAGDARDNPRAVERCKADCKKKCG